MSELSKSCGSGVSTHNQGIYFYVLKMTVYVCVYAQKDYQICTKIYKINIIAKKITKYADCNLFYF